MPAYQQPFPPHPSGPFVDSTIWNGQRWGKPLHTLLDTGADQTVIPDLHARALQLKKTSSRGTKVRDYNGQPKYRPEYIATIEIQGLGNLRPMVQVIGGDDPEVAFIGEWIFLNDLVITLDGPKGEFSIARPATSTSAGASTPQGSQPIGRGVGCNSSGNLRPCLSGDSAFLSLAFLPF